MMKHCKPTKSREWKHVNLKQSISGNWAVHDKNGMQMNGHIFRSCGEAKQWCEQTELRVIGVVARQLDRL